jgi:hypothetical protein
MTAWSELTYVDFEQKWVQKRTDEEQYRMVIKKSEHDILEISRITLYNTLTENTQIKKKCYGLLSYCIVNENFVILRNKTSKTVVSRVAYRIPST